MSGSLAGGASENMPIDRSERLVSASRVAEVKQYIFTMSAKKYKEGDMSAKGGVGSLQLVDTTASNAVEQAKGILFDLGRYEYWVISVSAIRDIRIPAPTESDRSDQ